MKASSHALGDIVLPSSLHPEFDPGGEPALLAHTSTIGCLDAPSLLPAGACERFELKGGKHHHTFAAQQLFVRP